MVWLVAAWIGGAVALAGPQALTSSEASTAIRWMDKHQARRDALRVEQVELRLDGSAATLDISLADSERVSTTPPARELSLTAIAALYLGSVGADQAPLGPGGRLAAQGMRHDITWTVTLHGQGVAVPPVVLGRAHRASDHSAGELSFLPPLLPVSAWDKQLHEARSGCSEVLNDADGRMLAWYDATGAQPTRRARESSVPKWHGVSDERVTYSSTEAGRVMTSDGRYGSPLVVQGDTAESPKHNQFFRAVRDDGRLVAVERGASHHDHAVAGGALPRRAEASRVHVAYEPWVTVRWSGDDVVFLSRTDGESTRTEVTRRSDGSVERVAYWNDDSLWQELKLVAPSGLPILTYERSTETVSLQSWSCPAPSAPAYVPPTPVDRFWEGWDEAAVSDQPCSDGTPERRSLPASSRRKAEAAAALVEQRIAHFGVRCSTVKATDDWMVATFRPPPRDPYLADPAGVYWTRETFDLLVSEGQISLHVDAPEPAQAAMVDEVARGRLQGDVVPGTLTLRGTRPRSKLPSVPTPKGLLVAWDEHEPQRWSGTVVRAEPVVTRQHMERVALVDADAVPGPRGLRIELGESGMAALEQERGVEGATWVTLMVDGVARDRVPLPEGGAGVLTFRFEQAEVTAALLRSPPLDLSQIRTE